MKPAYWIIASALLLTGCQQPGDFTGLWQCRVLDAAYQESGDHEYWQFTADGQFSSVYVGHAWANSRGQLERKLSGWQLVAEQLELHPPENFSAAPALPARYRLHLLELGEGSLSFSLQPDDKSPFTPYQCHAVALEDAPLTVDELGLISGPRLNPEFSRTGNQE